jgi:hypothetical protein
MVSTKMYLSRFWNRYLSRPLNLLADAADYFIEPFSYVIFLTLIISRIQAVMDAMKIDGNSLEEVFRMDISQNKLVYELFMVVFAAFLAVKIRNNKREKEFKDTLMEALKGDIEVLNRIDKKLGRLVSRRNK